jgi:hypothetical protein
MAIGKKKKTKKGINPIWEIDYTTSTGPFPVTWRAANRIQAIQQTRAWIRKSYPDMKIIKVARVRKA